VTEAFSHALEAMQCFVEGRRGGETGIRAVQRIEGDAVWKAAAEGRWSQEMRQAALSRGQKVVPGQPEQLVNRPVACFLEYSNITTAFAPPF
jgi:hypothetical protein